MPLSHYLDQLTRFSDWFIPADIAANREQREKARIFLYSHICGPFIGNTVPLSIWVFDQTLDYRVITLMISITSFWIFPPLLKIFGRYYLLSIVSVQVLIFTILWSCYFYGGLSSPNVSWMLTIPLLSFMYVGSSTQMRAVLIGQFTVNALIYYILCVAFEAPEVTLATPALEVLGLVSTAAACAYVTMMALFYANALASQVELQVEVDLHLATAADLLAATEDARRSSTAKSDFIARMSHELRTPLNAIIGYSEILLDDADGDPVETQDLERIREAGKHLLKLVNRILDLSRIEAGRMETVAESTNCAHLVQRVVEDFKPLAAKHGDALSWKVQPGVGILSTDAHKLRQILGTLVENAVQYTRNGEIVVSIERGEGFDGEAAVIVVRDNGPGIPDDRLPKVLNNFDVLDDDKENPDSGGAGLGLPLARRLSELIGAKLRVESQVGMGTAAFIHLPVGSVAKHAGEEEGMDVAPTSSDLKALANLGAAMRAKETQKGECDDQAAVG
jgi:signal transduction histidine kinase